MRRRASRGTTWRGRIQPRRVVLSSRRRASFKRDALGRVVEREERVLAGDAVTSRYEYDVRGRLVSVTTNGVVSESYAYDANGNRLGGEYDAQDRQLAFGSATYAYDLNGSMTNRNGAALTWNLFGRLMSVGNVAYWRDEQQRIRGKMIDGEPTKGWIWSGSRIIAGFDRASEEICFFVYAGATAPAYMIRNGVTYRIITDNQGSVRLVVNAATGDVAQRLDYDSFGRVLCDTNPGFQPFGFQGGLYDPDTGLVEFGCRWYDAETGRWISKDPIGMSGGMNLYVACRNDFVNHTDGYGLYPGERSYIETEEGRCLNGDKIANDIRLFYDGIDEASHSYWWVPKGFTSYIALFSLSGGPWGPCDFKYNDSEYRVYYNNEYFQADEFGNYIAGYQAGYSGVKGLLTGVKIGGWLWSAAPGDEPIGDAGSLPMINRGYNDGVRMRARKENGKVQK